MNQQTRIRTALVATAIAVLTLVGAAAAPAHATTGPPGGAPRATWTLVSNVPAAAGYRFEAKVTAGWASDPTSASGPVVEGKLAELQWDTNRTLVAWNITIFDANNNTVGRAEFNWIMDHVLFFDLTRTDVTEMRFDPASKVVTLFRR